MAVSPTTCESTNQKEKPACRRAQKETSHMNHIPTPADLATLIDAAMTRAPRGLFGAKYDPHAPVFVQLSQADAEDSQLFGTITSISRSREGTWLFRVDCPFCGRQHRHGGGGGLGLPQFGHRVADCGIGSGYALLAVGGAAQ